MATLEKIKSAEPVGTYTRTSVDDQKDRAIILLQYAYGNGYDVRSKIALKGRGVKHYGEDRYFVTVRMIEQLRKQHEIACDF